jgi:hypothetical protein
MPRSRPFAESDYSRNLVWTAEGKIVAVSNLGHRAIFILGERHRDNFLKVMRSQRTKSTSSRLSPRERRALDHEL